MRRKFERVLILLVFVASPFWLPRLPPSVTSNLRMTFLGLAEPFLTAAQSMRAGLWNLLSGTARGPFLLEENQVLRRKLAILQAHEETHRELSQENARLKHLAGFQAQSPWRTVPAEVIAHELGVLSRTLLINKGARDGIRVGMAVVTPVGLVGRVVEVGPSLSRLVALTDPHFRVSGISSKARVAGLVSGTTSGSCLLTYLPTNTQVQPGEVVFSKGGRSFCPEGVAIGRVESVAQDSSNLFRAAKLKLIVDLSAAEEVLVVTWPNAASGS